MRSCLRPILFSLPIAVALGCGEEGGLPDDGGTGDRPEVPGDIEPEVLVDADEDAAEGEVVAVCGDRLREDGEECDDGNDVAGDGCEPDCRFSCHDDEECIAGSDDPCLTETCETVAVGRRCGRIPNPGTACDDGNGCTVDDRCDSRGICRPGTNVCPCPGGATEECAEFEDGNLCNGTLACNPTTRRCEVDPTTVVTCPPDGPCRTYACVPATGEPFKPSAHDAGAETGGVARRALRRFPASPSLVGS
jgi:cysteine-rich repeat protein